MASAKYLIFKVILRTCGQLPVVLGGAAASELFRLSFADVLDEEADRGYQRPFDARHSREFSAYIQTAAATTIPLTFNLRGPQGDGWRLEHDTDADTATLSVRVPSEAAPAVLAQVDCQHRLGMMRDSAIPLTFQCFLGLDAREEMAIFNVINGKAKGLSSSLLDYHTTKLLPDLESIRLDLYIAKLLNDDPDSVWHGKVKLGGRSTQGSKRRTSLRGLQTATKALLQRRPFDTDSHMGAPERYLAVRDFWTAVVAVWPTAWNKPRTHLLTKGVGVTALSLLAADIIAAMVSRQRPIDSDAFLGYLMSLSDVDWSSKGPFEAYGGRRGATEAHKMLAAGLTAVRLAVTRD
jgi:DNA sulfur modification protein DndB